MLNTKFIEEFMKLKLSKKHFDFFDIIPPKEVLISKWVEFILNPKANGIGNKLLQNLINLTNYNYNLEDYEFDVSETEVSTDNLKRMDIVLKYKGLWIVIENKIDSLENGMQTNEYYNYIEKTKTDNEVIYIYLKPTYNKSIPINSNFIIITYDKFITKLKNIHQNDYIEQEKFKYLKEFIISGERFMKNEEIEITDSINFYIKQLDKFNAIEEEYNNKNKLLLDKIKNEITNYMNDKLMGYETYRTGNYIQIFKNNWHNNKHQGIHFEVIFKDAKVLGRILTTLVTLHIENSITEQQLNNFKLINITKQGNQAKIDNEDIKIKLELNFSNNEVINNSINLINEELFKLVQRYEKLIDKILDM